MYLCYESQRAVSAWADTDMVTLVTRAWPKVQPRQAHPTLKAGNSCEFQTGASPKGGVVLSPYGLDIVESCLTCKMRTERIFCDLPTAALESFEAIKYATAYPKGAVLFVEGQAPRGIFVLCKGRVKLSICATDGKTLILKIAEPGEVLGLSATVSGKPYELTAETIDPCQVNFVKREDFLRFLKDHSDACFKVAEQLSEKYNNACHEVRSLGLSHSAGEKLAKLLLEWSSRNGEAAKQEPRLKLALTHEEIAQMIGTSRETVTRLFADLKKRQIIQAKGSTLVVRNKVALKTMATNG
jgi:CRP/FNR family transcriptional regulator, cyclic AMP receptor protein